MKYLPYLLIIGGLLSVFGAFGYQGEPWSGEYFLFRVIGGFFLAGFGVAAALVARKKKP